MAPAAPAAALRLLLAVACLALGSVPGAADPQGPPPDAAGEEEELEALRERLTEREDENRVEEPWSTDLFGRPLTLSGEYELRLVHLPLVDPDGRPAGNRLRVEQEVEVEAFYPLTPSLFLLAQLRPSWEILLEHQPGERAADVFVERGEAWLHAVGIAGSGVDLELGRLNFEDDRRWWWDEDLDAVRLSWEGERVDLAVAAARELAPERLDRGEIDADQDGVNRVIVEASWDWRRRHALELFGLHQDDRSGLPAPGGVFRDGREDESDARLTWLGLRATGAWPLGARGLLGYWIDLAGVRGSETLVAFDEEPAARLVAGERTHQRVRGWGLDLGATWILPGALEPRFTVGYARGSGDADPDDGADHAYRQSGVHTNEVAFGGVQRFPGYGLLLLPELSNLEILTLGAGVTVLESSSLDLVYHAYRLVEPADGLRDSGLDPVFDGRNRGVGHGVDAVLAIEEWDRLELELTGSVFRNGAAFGRDEGRWRFGGAFAIRIAF